MAAMAFDWMSKEMKEGLEMFIAAVLALGIGIPLIMLRQKMLIRNHKAKMRID